MTKDFIIGFNRTDENKVQIVRFDTIKSLGRLLPTARDPFVLEVEQRQPPPPEIIKIDPSTLGELRDNDVDDGRYKVLFAGDQISKWLLGSDVSEALLTMLTALPPDQQLRLIFRVDKSLRETFDSTQLPVELIRPEGQDMPYVLSERVASVIHLVDDEMTDGGAPASALDWPLRILIVRSNPKDLGLAVPEAAPIRDKILQLGDQQFAPGAVIVDVLSSEPAINKPATWTAFTEQMKANDDPYSLVIYLGHGSVNPDDGSSCLQFEDGDGHADIPHYQIISPFQRNPAPVVLLVACLTADQIMEQYREIHKKKMSNWLRGSRGVAQTLISSTDTRTQLAVGMRYRLDAGDATLFLESFFDSLLRNNRGNVEAAVRSARQALMQHSRFPAAFSSPVIFRRLHANSGVDEQLLSFIKEKPFVSTVCQGPAGEWHKLRLAFWENLISTGWTARAEEWKRAYLDALSQAENFLIQSAIPTSPLILPESVVILPEGSGTFTTKLHGSLAPEKIDRVVGDLLFDRDDIVITGATTTDELRAKGYRVSTDIFNRSIHFTIQPAGDNVEPLENVALFNVNVGVGKEFPLLSRVNVSGLQSTPAKRICPGTNMLIIPPP